MTPQLGVASHKRVSWELQLAETPTFAWSSVHTNILHDQTVCKCLQGFGVGGVLRSAGARISACQKLKLLNILSEKHICLYKLLRKHMNTHTQFKHTNATTHTQKLHHIALVYVNPPCPFSVKEPYGFLLHIIQAFFLLERTKISFTTDHSAGSARL